MVPGKNRTNKYGSDSPIHFEQPDLELFDDLGIDPISAGKYLRQYYRILVKAGGEIVETPEYRDSLAFDIALLARYDVMPVVVHGGKNRISKYMKEAGIETEFVNGQRKTPFEAVNYRDKDDNRLPPVVKALFELNSELRKAIEGYGCKTQRIWDSVTVSTSEYALGNPGVEGEGCVGYPTWVVFPGYSSWEQMIETAKIMKGFSEGEFELPVISPICFDYASIFKDRDRPSSDPRLLNVNADFIAEENAKFFGVRKFVSMITERGVYGRNGILKSTLTVKEAERMLNNGTIHGGMIPKVESLVRIAKYSGIPTAMIDGTKPHSLMKEICTDVGYGTELKLRKTG